MGTAKGITTESDPVDGREAGAAIVEFALVVGLVLYLVLGGISLGVLLATTHGLEEAAGEAARIAALTPDDPSTPGDERSEAALASLASNALVDDGCTDGTDGLTCTVTIAACTGEPSRTCLTVELDHDRSVDTIVGSIPLVEAALPDDLHAEATTTVADA